MIDAAKSHAKSMSRDRLFYVMAEYGVPFHYSQELQTLDNQGLAAWLINGLVAIDMLGEFCKDEGIES